MRYLDEEDIAKIGIDWFAIIDCLRESAKSIKKGDFAQPLKPYLRYKGKNNRIIAMPAYIGGQILMSGLKWIASFPGNHRIGIPRAHCTMILNNPDTGVPVGVINSARISSIRTAGVSALMLKYAMPRKDGPIRFGIVGFGPIGQMHLKMLFDIYNEKIEKLYIYDLKGVNKRKIEKKLRSRIIIASCWQEAFESEVFITCTVTKSRYIKKAPVRGSLHMNISLRDYDADFLRYVDKMIVDDWNEVCRENTDIEIMHKEKGLKQDDTISISDLVAGNPAYERKAEDVVMFNPMGMAVFDIAVGAHYLKLAKEKKVGVKLG